MRTIPYIPLPASCQTPLGLYDMHGNVSEMLDDYGYGATFPSNPLGPYSKPSILSYEVYKSLRGGSYASAPNSLTSQYRTYHNHVTRTATVGFRLARSASNSQPSTPSARISPQMPNINEELHCSITDISTDIDGDSLAYDFTWLRNGQIYTGATLQTDLSGDTIPQSELSYGQTWTCRITASDGQKISNAARVDIEITPFTNKYYLPMYDTPSSAFVKVEAGTEPGSRYILRGDIFVQSTEVTEGMIQSVLHKDLSVDMDCGSDCPATNVTWYEAAAFANRISELEEMELCYDCEYNYEDPGSVTTCALSSEYDTPYDCDGYRLPT
jgi:hypothetical protein